MIKPSMKDSRKARRVEVACRLFFFGENDFEGEAQLLDLSATGCRAKSETAVEVGQRLNLSIFLPDQIPWPIRVDASVVRRSSEGEFGLEFLAIRPPQLHRIQHFMMKKRR